MAGIGQNLKVCDFFLSLRMKTKSVEFLHATNDTLHRWGTCKKDHGDIDNDE